MTKLTFVPATPYLMNLKVVLGSINRDIMALQETKDRLGEEIARLYETSESIKSEIRKLGEKP